MKLARHIALVKKEDNGEKVKVPAASDEKGESVTYSKNVLDSKEFIYSDIISYPTQTLVCIFGLC